ncbi:hypothetical protein [Phenylobacterium sp.]|uniref:hypothetical protein n=1 Tax=Phenylobacterium sp. TaxID=1871053 RepID=UPI002C7E3757|nr:hypothetical protein [Phenylobacterium sp.]HVI33669.1 hypothetical protein [Phenylobacterium sp.]
MRSVVQALLSSCFVLSLLLAGPATAAQVINAVPPSQRAPAPDEGVLTLSVTVNTGAVGQFDTLVLKRADISDPKAPEAKYEYRAPEITGRVARDTSLFVASLKAGDYVIVELRDSERLTTFTPGKANSTLGSFKIAAGKLTDLGRIVVTPVNFHVGVGRSSLVPSNAALVARFAPSTSNFYRETLSSGWNTPRSETDVIEQFALDHPVGASTLVELPDGQVAAATRLGTILLRGANGRWKALRSGTLDAWLGVAPGTGPDAMLVAVGEYSNIARVDAAGAFHPVDRGNLPMGTLIFVAGDAAHGWVVALKLNTTVTLYRTDSLDKPDWTPLLTDKLTANFWSGGQQLWLWPTKTGFGYARSTGEIRFYNTATRSWTDRTSPNKKPIITIYESPGGEIGILSSPGGGFGGVTAAAWLSRDGANTWESTGSPYRVKVQPPKLTTSGLMLQSGGVFGGAALQGSRDLGKTWAVLSDKVAVTDVVLVMPTTGLFKLAKPVTMGTPDYDLISHSSDDGVTWTTEYTSLERELLRAQAEAGK